MVFLFDMQGGRIGHVFQPSIKSLRNLMRLVEEACPFNLRAVHVLNTAPFLNLVLGKLKIRFFLI